MRKPIIGVMGPGNDASDDDIKLGYDLGKLIAEHGWVLLSGGRDQGVMESSCRGAREAGGLVVGVLPEADKSQMSEAVDIPIITGMGSARNVINILSSDVVVACGQGGPGTASEVAHALKAGQPVILLGASAAAQAYWQELSANTVICANSAEDTVAQIDALQRS